MQKLNFLSSERGSALLAAVIFSLVFAIMAAGTIQMLVTGSDVYMRDMQVIRSYWANEGAQRVAMRYISRLNSPGNITVTTLSVSPAIVLNGYAPVTSITSNLISAGSYSYTVSSQDTIAGSTLLNKTSCSSILIKSMQRYTWFEDRTGPVWASFTVNGDYHTNGYMDISNSMSAVAHVTGQATTGGRISSASTYDRANYTNPYRRGIKAQDNSWSSPPGTNWFETRFPNYSNSGQVQIDSLAPSASNFSSAYTVSNTDAIAVNLKGNKVDIYKKISGTWTKTVSDLSISAITNGIIKSSNNTYVWGNLDGKLTIVSGNTHDVYIAGPITYQNSNLSTSDDVLALVAGDDVVISSSTSIGGYSYSFKNSGGTVDASLFMKNGGLLVENLSTYTAIRNFSVRGGVLMDLDYAKYSSGKGICGTYTQDPRTLNNTAIAPGIPFAKSADEELTGQFMWVLGRGTWENKILPVN